MIKDKKKCPAKLLNSQRATPKPVRSREKPSVLFFALVWRWRCHPGHEIAATATFSLLLCLFLCFFKWQLATVTSSSHYNSLRPPDGGGAETSISRPWSQRSSCLAMLATWRVAPRWMGVSLCRGAGAALQLISLATARLTVTSCVKSSLQQSLPAFLTRKRKLIGYGWYGDIFTLSLFKSAQTNSEELDPVRKPAISCVRLWCDGVPNSVRLILILYMLTFMTELHSIPGRSCVWWGGPTSGG